MADNIVFTHRLRSAGIVRAQGYLANAEQLLARSSDGYLLALKLSVAARIEHQLGGASASYDELALCDHEVALAARIDLSLAHDDVASAVEIADSFPLTEQWAEQAAVAYIHADQYSKATNACDFLRKPGRSLVRYYRSIFRCAIELFHRCQERADGKLTPGALPSGVEPDLIRAREIIGPFVTKVQSAGRISDFLEREAIALRMCLAHVLVETIAVEMSGLLAGYRPLHRDVLSAIRWGLLPATARNCTH